MDKDSNWWGDSKRPSPTPSHDLTADEQARLEAHNAKDYLETARKSAEHAAQHLEFVSGLGEQKGCDLVRVYDALRSDRPRIPMSDLEVLTTYRVLLEQARNDWLRANAEWEAAQRTYGARSEL